MPKTLPKVVKDIRKQKPVFVNYGTEKSVSHSQLTQYYDCPHKWALNQKLKIYSPSIHAIFGVALHYALQEYLTVMYNISGAAADRIDVEGMFLTKLKEEYAIGYKKNKQKHFSNPGELEEFHMDGLEIIRYVKRKRNAYFSKKGWYLVGCEVPITVQPSGNIINLYYRGYLDVVFYHEPTNTIKILDLKTSTRGWNDKDKKNEVKQAQLILYKSFFAEQYGFPIDNIEIEFMIMRRKVYEEGDFPQKRIQEFIPASGKIKVNKANQLLENFLNDAFNQDGSIKNIEFEKKPEEYTCKFCIFQHNRSLCDKNEKNKIDFTIF